MPSLINAAFDPPPDAPDRPSASLLNRAPALADIIARNPVGTSYLPAGDYGAQSVGNQGPPGSFDAIRGTMPGGQPMMQSDLDAAHAKIVDAYDMAKNVAFGMTGEAPGGKGFTAYHGSPHDFPPTANNPLGEFDQSKIGTGEGNQSFGSGAPYLADAEDVARIYRNTLGYKGAGTDWADPVSVASYWTHNLGTRDAAISYLDSVANAKYFKAGPEVQSALDYLKDGGDIKPPPNAGRIYEVHVAAEPETFLDWDKPLIDQPESVQRTAHAYDLGSHSYVGRDVRRGTISGAGMYDALANSESAPWASLPTYEQKAAAASDALKNAGVPGIRYFDANSRGVGEGSRNTVIFDPSIVRIMRKYAVPAAMLSGTGHGLALGGSDTTDTGQ